MERNLYIDASHPNETRVVLKSDENIEDYEYEGLKNNLIKNNIYLGKVSRIEPSLQAAFIDFGSEKKAFLPFDEIHPSYFKIPHNEKIVNNDSSNEDIDDEKKNKKQFLSFYRKYKIQDVIKKDQVLLIQIVKEETKEWK